MRTSRFTCPAIGEERVGREQAPLRVLPAQQRLDRDDRPVARASNVGWKCRRSSLGLDRPAQLGRGLDPGQQLAADPVVVDLVAVPARRPWRRTARCRRRAAGRSGVSSARVASAMPMLVERRTSCPPATNGSRIVARMRSAIAMVSVPLRTSSQHTTNSSPPNRATVSDGRTVGPQSRRGLDEDRVARRVPERVVHELEVVEVEEQQRDASTSSTRSDRLQRVAEPVASAACGSGGRSAGRAASGAAAPARASRCSVTSTAWVTSDVDRARRRRGSRSTCSRTRTPRPVGRARAGARRRGRRSRRSTARCSWRCRTRALVRVRPTSTQAGEVDVVAAEQLAHRPVDGDDLAGRVVDRDADRGVLEGQAERVDLDRRGRAAPPLPTSARCLGHAPPQPNSPHQPSWYASGPAWPRP